MKLSSPRFKSMAVTLGFSFWFFIILNSVNIFSIEIFLIFIATVFVLTQLLSLKIESLLNYFAIINTKIFLGITFIGLIIPYGIFFKILKIDPLRTKIEGDSYWLKIDKIKDSNNWKQY
jgi:hypothetical protein|tara:strand:+ start:147 stop:503 length:357 start_codon:yes stop_codon:yes gene_type:complete